MTTKYAIRQNEFAYNDEWYMTSHIESTRIQQTFDDYDTAKTAYKKLIADHIRSEGFDNYDIGNGDAYVDSKVYETIDKFTQEKFGETYEDIYEIDFSQCSDDELVQLAQDIDFEPYQLISIDDNERFYAIWLNYQDCYLTNYGDVVTLDSSLLGIELEDKTEITQGFLDNLNGKRPTGELSELSDSPELLKQLLDENYQVSYYNNTLNVPEHYWNFDYDGFNQLEAVNALLKQPWFELRALSFNELQQLS